MSADWNLFMFLSKSREFQVSRMLGSPVFEAVEGKQVQAETR
jgi:hypothetical protein